MWVWNQSYLIYEGLLHYSTEDDVLDHSPLVKENGWESFDLYVEDNSTPSQQAQQSTPCEEQSQQLTTPSDYLTEPTSQEYTQISN